MFKSSSTSLILIGVLAVIIGIVAIAWPGVTILVAGHPVRGLRVRGRAGCRPCGPSAAGRPARSSVTCCSRWSTWRAGLFALAWPAPTAFVLVIVVAAWALAGGVAEFFAGFRIGESAGTRALFIVSGLVSFAFGVLLFARPGVGAVTLALLFGLYALIYGFSQITAGIQVRQLRADAEPLSELRHSA